MKDNNIDLVAVKSAYTAFERSLDDSFFKVRYNRATPEEKRSMLAMAKCDKLPCTIAQISKEMNVTESNISLIMEQIIYKGLIYDSQYEAVDFTVPQFNRYIKRVNDNRHIN
ncbi:MAG: hypothetical protein H6Q67_1383 [Firmicutes bacterium]|nr:hypothetical protein [Bacillota bacterium]